ncbi:MAG: PAQR family membrane homeostasis protein TrhA [Spirochaetota bacterium]
MEDSRQHNVEQRLNAVTHSIGAGLSIAGAIVLLVLTVHNEGGRAQFTAFLIYGVCQIFLYLSSTVTHQFSDFPKVYQTARLLDQAAVFFLIAGTYTPIALLIMPEPWRQWMLAVIWTLALLGTVLKTVVYRRKHILSDLLYLPMGWLVLVFLKPLLQQAETGFLLLVLLAAVFYSGGVYFYVSDRIPFNHVIWHLSVLAGGLCFFLGFLWYLV